MSGVSALSILVCLAVASYLLYALLRGEEL